MKIIINFRDVTQWHKWFAWYPVIVDWNNTRLFLAWLVTLERKVVYNNPFFRTTIYREIDNTCKTTKDGENYVK